MSSSKEDVERWKTLRADDKDILLAGITNTIECVVCSEIMHVPFILSCGHSFCYECLNAWFETKLSCPTCRHDQENDPILNIQLKEIIKNLSDLLGKSTKSPEEKQKFYDHRDESLKSYEYDYKHKKLFGEAFKAAITLIDRSDGVPRCGNCHWEAHGSVCLHCGTRFRIPHDDAYFDSDDGDAYNEDDEEVVLYGNDDDNRYDSSDSFLDNRDMSAINDDIEGVEDDGLSSSHSLSVDEIEWNGFEVGSSNSMSPEPFEQSADLERALEELHDTQLNEDSDNSDNIVVTRPIRTITIVDSDEED